MMSTLMLTHITTKKVSKLMNAENSFFSGPVFVSWDVGFHAMEA